MRWLLLLVAACSEPTHPSVPPPSVVDASKADPSIPACANATPFQARGVIGVAVNGSERLASVVTASSGYELLAVAAQQTTVASSSEPIAVATRGGVAFYALKQASGYEVHQRAGGADTVLGTVSTKGPIELAASASDVYVLGGDFTSKTLWRVARTGGMPVAVATVDASAHGLVVGDTIAAFSATNSEQTVALPGPSTPVVHTPQGKGVWLVGDVAFTYGTTRVASQTWAWSVILFIPGIAYITGELYMSNDFPPLFTDDRTVYVNSQHYAVVNKMLGSPVSGGPCFPFTAYDDTSHYGFAMLGPDSMALLAAPRP